MHSAMGDKTSDQGLPSKAEVSLGRSPRMGYSIHRTENGVAGSLDEWPPCVYEDNSHPDVLKNTLQSLKVVHMGQAVSAIA